MAPEDSPEAELDGNYDVIVIGGGAAGTVAAIAAARLGCFVALVQDRPVLGGNSSNEVRVSITGAAASGLNRNARETGILEELLLEDRHCDPLPTAAMGARARVGTGGSGNESTESRISPHTSTHGRAEL